MRARRSRTREAPRRAHGLLKTKPRARGKGKALTLRQRVKRLEARVARLEMRKRKKSKRSFVSFAPAGL